MYKRVLYNDREILDAKSVSAYYANLIQLSLEKSFLSLYSLRSSVYSQNNGTQIILNYDMIASSIIADTGDKVIKKISFHFILFHFSTIS